MNPMKMNRPMFKAIFVVSLITLFLFPCIIQAANYPSVWAPEKIQQTLDFEGAADISVTLISKQRLEDVNLWVVPELQRFVSLVPSHFASLEPNTPYEVRVHLSNPHGTRPGSYDGTVHLNVGKKTYPQTLKIELRIFYENVSIPSTTKVLDESSTRYLTSISADNSVLMFSGISPDLRSLSVGDIIVIGITSATPNGLLRKITNVSIVGNSLVVETSQATLEDAIEKGSITIDKQLSPNDIQSAITSSRGVALQNVQQVQAAAIEGFYIEINDVVVYDHDNNLSTTYDQIKANGTLAIDARLHIDWKIENHSLKELNFTVSNTISAEIEFKYDIGGRKNLEFVKHDLTPFVVWVGWLPVVIQPVLTGNLGVEAEISAGITTDISLGATLIGGVAITDGIPRPIGDVSANFSFTPPSPTLGGEVKGYVGPGLKVLIYGVAGPYAIIKTPFLELDVDLLATPWWELYGGIEAGVGLKFEIFGDTLADYYNPDVIGYRRLLAQAESNQGIISGIVKDAVANAPLQNVSIRIYDQNGLIATGQNNSDGSYSLSVPSGNGYRLEFSRTNYLTAIYYGVDVGTDTTTYLEAVLQIDAAHSGPGNVSGRVLNALNGTGLNGLILNLRVGINAMNGTVVASVYTGSNGSYYFNNLNAGNYTVEASGSGYNTAYLTITCIGGTTTGNQNITVTPILLPGETRIILTWGATPSDLDSHLTGPLPDGTRFHMFYPYAQSNSGSPWPQYVTLDLDDVTSYGPETTTIYQQINGTYRFSVHDYTNRFSSTSTALSNSSAQVRVYRGSALVATFSVPPNQGGTLWTVFELEGDTITAVNRMSFQSSPSNIQSFSLIGEYETDAPLMNNLPPKEN